jgi:hypothetical protein
MIHQASPNTKKAHTEKSEEDFDNLQTFDPNFAVSICYCLLMSNSEIIISSAKATKTFNIVDAKVTSQTMMNSFLEISVSF